MMIKDEMQRTMRVGDRENHLTRDIPNSRSIPIRRRLFRVTFKPVRRGMSQRVLDTADRMIEEYKSDLDYLKDR
jgi:hypothetical protein